MRVKHVSTACGGYIYIYAQRVAVGQRKKAKARLGFGEIFNGGSFTSTSSTSSSSFSFYEGRAGIDIHWIHANSFTLYITMVMEAEQQQQQQIHSQQQQLQQQFQDLQGDNFLNDDWFTDDGCDKFDRCDTGNSSGISAQQEGHNAIAQSGSGGVTQTLSFLARTKASVLLMLQKLDGKEAGKMYQYSSQSGAVVRIPDYDGKRAMLPRLSSIITPAQSHVPFAVYRRQFPLIPGYAFTVLRSQGSTLDLLGLYFNGSPCTLELELVILCSCACVPALSFLALLRSRCLFGRWR